MEFPQQVKTALNELPPAERVVALALKNIFAQIEQIQDEEKKQIDQTHLGFISRFKQIEQRASSVIQGKKLQQDDIANPNDYFLEGQKQDLQKALQSTQPLKQYWLTTLKNSNMKSLIGEIDEKILAHITEISTNVTTDTLEISISFADNEYLSACCIKRLIRLENGEAVEFKGDHIAPKQNIPDDTFLSNFCKDVSDPNELAQIYATIRYLTTEIVPYSLEFYLGGVDEDEDDEDFDQLDGDDEEDDDEEDEEEEEPKKSAKKSKPN